MYTSFDNIPERNMTPNQRVTARIKEVCRMANQLFRVDLKDLLTVEIRNCGTAAGKASCRRYGNSVVDLTLILNAQLVNEQDVSKLLEDTIPHEIAHLVCYVRPELGKNHDRGWRRVCIMLGGSGDRCHRYDLEKARKTRKAVYNINGNPTHIGLTVHKRIQSGAAYTTVCQQSRQRVRISPTQFTGKVVAV